MQSMEVIFRGYWKCFKNIIWKESKGNAVYECGYLMLFSNISTYMLLSRPQLNHNSTQPNITFSWVRDKNDFAYHPTPHTNSMLAISQLLLTRFWWNFKCRFMGTSITDIASNIDSWYCQNPNSTTTQLNLT